MFLRFISHSCSRLQTVFLLQHARGMTSQFTTAVVCKPEPRDQQKCCWKLSSSWGCCEVCAESWTSMQKKQKNTEREREKNKNNIHFFSLSLWLMNNYRRRCRCRFGILLPSICCAVCCAIGGQGRGSFSVKWVKNNELSHTTTRRLRRAHDSSALRFNFNENFSRRLSINIILHFNAKYTSTFHFS